MPSLAILAIQRLSAAERARIEAVDPAVRAHRRRRLVRRRNPRHLVGLCRLALSRPRIHRGGHARRPRPPARRGRGHPRQLPVSARSARAVAAAEMVPPASRRRQQPAHRRSVGQRRRRDDIARRRQHAGHGGIRDRRHPAFRQGPRPRVERPRGGHVRSSRLPAAAAGRTRPCAWSAPAASAARSAGWPPHSACASSARGAGRSRGRALPAGFAELGGTDDLDRFLAESDFVAICCQWTRGDHQSDQRGIAWRR